MKIKWRKFISVLGMTSLLFSSAGQNLLLYSSVVHATNNNQHIEVSICHATNGVNPYQSLIVDDDSILGENGHGSDTHQNGEDIIPPFDYQVWGKLGTTHEECPTSNSAYGNWSPDKTCEKWIGGHKKYAYPIKVDDYGWVKNHFDGKNWDETGQAIWDNDCQVPPVCDETVTYEKTGDYENFAVSINFTNGDYKITVSGKGEYEIQNIWLDVRSDGQGGYVWVSSSELDNYNPSGDQISKVKVELMRICPPVCGDGVMEGIEACDGKDGVGEHQECTDTCTLIDVPYCGDEVINQESEQCDDGNNEDGDGCSAKCIIEEPVCKEGPTWAAEVIDYQQGTKNNGNVITDSMRTNPEDVLGEASALTNGDDFYSLGKDGWIVVGFEYPVLDVDGNDLSFHEETWNNRFAYGEEKAVVSVSQNGNDWYEIGEVSNHVTDGVSYLDFSSTNLSWIKYVKLIDTTDYETEFANDGNADGYDLDAIDATYGVCEERPEDPKYAIHGYKWHDANGDGQRCSDLVAARSSEFIAQPIPEVCEEYLAGWEIQLWQGEKMIDSMLTDDGDHYGWYWFENLPAGEYEVCEVQQSGWIQTYPTENACHSVVLPDENPQRFAVTENAVVGPEYNFGNYQEFGSISGYKWYDLNGNSEWDDDEYGLSGWEIMTQKYLDSYEVLATGEDVVTTSLEAGKEYIVEVSGVANAGDTIDFDVEYSLTNKVSGDTWTDEVTAYESYGEGLLELRIDGGFVEWGVYNDTHIYSMKVVGTDAPLTLDVYDIYYPNNTGSFTVKLYEVVTVKTDSEGYYSLRDLPYGVYTVCELQQDGWSQTFPDGCHELTINGEVQDYEDVNFGNIAILGSISGYVWNDGDEDGVWDETEDPLENWEVYLQKLEAPLPPTISGVGGVSFLTTLTNNLGYYLFTRLTLGDYMVCETVQSDWTQSSPLPDGCHTVSLTAANPNQEVLNFGNYYVEEKVVEEPEEEENGVVEGESDERDPVVVDQVEEEGEVLGVSTLPDTGMDVTAILIAILLVTSGMLIKIEEQS